MSRPSSGTSIATRRPVFLPAALAWLLIVAGPAAPAPAEGVIPLSNLPVDSQPAAEPESIADDSSLEYADPDAVEPQEAAQCGYDNGFYLRYFNAQSQSFELKTNVRFQLRHAAFSRDEQTWIDRAGVSREIHNRSYFDVERARLVFSGHAFAPESKYFVQLDGDTDDGHTVEFFDCWWGYEFSEAYQIQCGKRKVPAVRNWLLPALESRLADRPMATDFFRPDRTVGVWLVGQPTERLHYELMIGNSYRPVNPSPAELNDRFAFAGTAYWDPLVPFGDGVTDFEQSSAPVFRVGHSWVYSSQSGLGNAGKPLPESDYVRLSDGTPLTQIGALSPGATVDSYDVLLNAVDLSMKYRGWSLNAEYFWQCIDRIQADTTLPVTDLTQQGFYVEAGFFVIPQRLELNTHYSRVGGEFANRNEYTGGFRWYFGQGKNRHFTFDVTALDGSPLNNTGSDILVGDHGVLFRSQFQATF